MKDQGFSFRRTITVALLSVGLGLLIIFTTIVLVEEISNADKAIGVLYEQAEQRQREDLRERVNNLFLRIDVQRKLGMKSDEQIQEEILSWLAVFRFNYGGYFFINQTDGKALIYDGQRITEDKYVNDMIDPEGRRLFDMELEAYHSPEGKFMTYQFKRIDSDQPEQKISFVRGMKEWNWIIGAGNYVRDMTEEVNLLKEETLKELKKTITIILAVFVIVAFFLILIGSYLAKSINKHILKLEHFAERLLYLEENEPLVQEKLFFKELNNFSEKLKKVVGDKRIVEADLKDTLMKAEQNSKLKSAFLNNLSHEIRTPLNSIMGFSNLLLDKDIDEQTKISYLEIVNRSSDHLLNMLNEILYVSRIESQDQVQLSCSWIQVNELLDEVKNMFIPDCKKLNIEFKAMTHPDYPDLRIWSDRNKVFQVLTSLASNALKFTEQGFIQIGFDVKDNICQFYVEDSGIGIHQDQSKMIFNSFYQIDNGLSKKYGGIGLGLNLAQKLVNILGGEIWVESEPGRGSTFLFTIPIHPDKDPIKNENL